MARVYSNKNMNINFREYRRTIKNAQSRETGQIIQRN